MNTLHRLLALPVLALTVATANAGTFAEINLVDSSFDDWSGVAASATNTGTGPIQQIFIANNDTHLFVRITFNTPTNILTGFRMNIDNDNNTGTGFNTFLSTLGPVIGSEVLYEGENAYQQATGSYNTEATTSEAYLRIGNYNQAVTSVEFGIVRTAIINTAESTPIFPNSTIKLGAYFGNDATSFNAAEYTFATAAVPEPSTYAALAGFGALSLAFFRRRR